MKEAKKADGMVEALMDMAQFCDRALRVCEDGEGSPLDTDVSLCILVMDCNCLKCDCNCLKCVLVTCNRVHRHILWYTIAQCRRTHFHLREHCSGCSVLLLQQFPSVVVMYSLKAMRHGCRAAVQRFPRLLQLLELYPATNNDFKKKVNCV